MRGREAPESPRTLEAPPQSQPRQPWLCLGAHSSRMASPDPWALGSYKGDDLGPALGASLDIYQAQSKCEASGSTLSRHWWAEDTLVHKEHLAGRGALWESPWPTRSGRTTRTSRQGLGLGEWKGGGLRARAMPTQGPQAHLPQPHHRAASQTPAVPGALWREAQCV